MNEKLLSDSFTLNDIRRLDNNLLYVSISKKEHHDGKRKSKTEGHSRNNAYPT